MRPLQSLVFVLALLHCGQVLAETYEPAGCLRAEEIELAELVNQYRAENGLDPVPLSRSLTAVAQWHLADVQYAMVESGEYGSDPECNLHTWYGAPGAPYTTCCYTSDHAQAACMWNKPSEVSGGAYTSSGYEIAAWGYATPAAALNGWKQSAGHDAVLLNTGIWESSTWRAMGVGVDPASRHYFVWFAVATDPAAGPADCSTTAAPPMDRTVTRLDIAPNPFNPRTRIRFELGREARVEAVLYDVQGRVVRQFDARTRPAGPHEIGWDGQDAAGQAAPSGIYYLRLTADGRSTTRKLALIR